MPDRLSSDMLRSYTALRFLRKGERPPLFVAVAVAGSFDSYAFETTEWEKRRGWDSNPRWSYPHSGFRDRPVQPLQHLSECGRRIIIVRERKRFANPWHALKVLLFCSRLHSGEKSDEKSDEVCGESDGCRQR